MADLNGLKDNIVSLSEKLSSEQITDELELVEKTINEWAETICLYLETVSIGTPTALTKSVLKPQVLAGLTGLCTISISPVNFVTVLLTGIDAGHALLAAAASTGDKVATPPFSVPGVKAITAAAMLAIMAVPIDNADVVAAALAGAINDYTKSGIYVLGSGNTLNWS